MTKKLIITILAGALIVPSAVQASIFDDFYGVVKGLQKQVLDLVSANIELIKPVQIKATTTEEVWNVYASSTLGYKVQYPKDFATTTIFSIIPDYTNADAFVKISREDFLSKILKPGSVSVDLATQDSAIFFRLAKSDDMYLNPLKYLGKISTSTKQIGSTTVEYILHSTKTDEKKFGSGSTEKIIFTNGSTTIMAEVNFSTEVPSGPIKVVFDKMLTTFKFLEASSTPVLGVNASSTLARATSTELVSSTSTIKQTAGAVLSQ